MAKNKPFISTTDWKTIVFFWRAGLPHRRLGRQSLLFPLGAVLLGVAAPLCIGKALGALVLPGTAPQTYLYWFIGIAALGLIANRLGHTALMTFEARVLRDLQEKTLATLLARSMSFHNNNVGGKLVSDAIDFPIAYARMADSTATSLLPLFATLFIGSIVIYSDSWLLGLFVTAMTIIVVGVGVWDSRRLAPRRQQRQKAGKVVTAHLADVIGNVQTTKIFAREQEELGRHQELGENYADIRIRDWRELSKNGNNRMWILSVCQAGLVFLIISLVQRDPQLLGMGIFAFSFTVMLSNRLFEVNMLLRNIEEALLQASPMTEIMEEQPEILDVPGAKAVRVKQGAVAFDAVTFAYADAPESPVFSQLRLSIAPGEKIGLVGPSGGGKSTLTKLLLRFEDSTTGTIRIDDQDITRVTQQSLREAISYVPQEPLLFHRTISENIAYGKPHATAKEITRAAKLAHADEFIRRLPNGYTTIVGERGVKLSGGQRQRIAIARAILKNAPILLLDEATSALDSESEVLIQDALWQLMEGRTAIVVAHRLSTIQKMDRIIVLTEGGIAEEGSHTELLRKNGLYAALWKHQSGGFIDDDA